MELLIIYPLYLPLVYYKVGCYIMQSYCIMIYQFHVSYSWVGSHWWRCGRKSLCDICSVMIQRSWVQPMVWLNLGTLVLMSKSYLNQSVYGETVSPIQTSLWDKVDLMLYRGCKSTLSAPAPASTNWDGSKNWGILLDRLLSIASSSNHIGDSHHVQNYVQSASVGSTFNYWFLYKIWNKNWIQVSKYNCVRLWVYNPYICVYNEYIIFTTSLMPTQGKLKSVPDGSVVTMSSSSRECSVFMYNVLYILQGSRVWTLVK